MKVKDLGPSEHSLGALDRQFLCCLTKTFSSVSLLHDGGRDMMRGVSNQVTGRCPLFCAYFLFRSFLLASLKTLLSIFQKGHWQSKSMAIR